MSLGQETTATLQPQSEWVDQRRLVAALVATALLTVAFWRRRDLAAGLKIAWDAGKQRALALAAGATIGTRAVQYTPYVIEAAAAEGLSVLSILALGARESRWGGALDPPGPEGVGDKAPRGERDPPGYGLDGRRGWGYGLMQIDVGSFPDFVSSGKWRDARENIHKGAAVLAAKMRYLAATPKTPSVTLSEFDARRRGVAPGVYRDPRPLRGDLLLRASLAAYNTGELNVLKSVAVGVDPDVTTAGGNYSGDVVGRAQTLASRFAAEGGTA